jgi:hypothetical protein
MIESEQAILDTVIYLASSYPSLFLGLSSLGGIFIFLEVFVKLTPSKKDDKFFESMKDSYSYNLLMILWKKFKK